MKGPIKVALVALISLLTTTKSTGQIKLLDSLAFDNTSYGIDMSKDQEKLFVAGKDSNVYITSINGQITRILKGHDSSVSSVDYHEKSEIILSGSYDNSAMLWNKSGELLIRLEGHEAGVINVAQSDWLIATASRDKTVKVWNRKGDQVAQLRHEGQVNDVMFVEDKEWIITASFDGTVKVWDYDGNQIHSITLASGVRAVNFSRESNLLLAGHRNGTISIFKPTGQIQQVIEAHGLNDEEYKMVNSIQISDDESFFISGAADGYIKAWNFSGELLLERRLSDIQNAYVSGISLVGNLLASSSGGGDDFVRIWDLGAFTGKVDYTCANESYDYLSRTIGTWDVQTKDRTSLGEYENNIGVATIEPLIEGCGITISYRGTYKSKPYAREVSIIGKDTSTIQMVALDSEHGSYSELNGSIADEVMELVWYRNEEVGRVRSKYVMTFTDKDAFEFSSFLSTDYAETWALTHQRLYKRKE